MRRPLTLLAELHSPIVCRCAGLPYRYIAEIDTVAGAPDADLASVGAPASARAALWRILDDDHFVDCLATQSPQVVATYLRRRPDGPTAKRNSYMRGLERGLYRFVTRFAARNDTTGTAGSTFWGTFADASDHDLRYVPGPSRHSRRRVYTSPAQVLALAAELGAGPLEESAVWTFSPTMRLLGDNVLNTATRAFVTIARGSAAFLRECAKGGVSCVGAEDKLPPGELERLIHHGVLERRLRIPRPRGVDGGLLQIERALDEAPARPDVAAEHERMQELLHLRDALESARGMLFADLMERSDRIVSRSLSASASLEDMGSTILDWLFVRGPLERLPLRLSSRFWLSDDGSLVDRVSQTASRLSPALAAALALVARGQLDAIRPGARADMLTLFLKGVFAVGGYDPRGKSDSTLVRRTLAALRRSSAHDAGLTTMLTPFGATPTTIGQRLSVGARAIEGLRALGLRLPRPRNDRNFFVCDSARDVRAFAIGGELRRSMRRDLGQLLLLAGYQHYVRERAILRELSRLIRPGTAVPLAAVLQALPDPDGMPHHEQSDEVSGGTGSAMPVADTTYHEAQRRLDVAAIAYPPAFQRWLTTKRLISNVDLMLQRSADGTGWQTILNEAHAVGSGMPATTRFPAIQPGDEEVNASRGNHVKQVFGDRVLIMPTEATKQSEAILSQLSGVHVAVDGVGAWVEPGTDTIPVGELDVRRDRDQFRLVDQDGATYRFVSNRLCIGDLRCVTAHPQAMGQYFAELVPPTVARRSDGAIVWPEVRIGQLVLARPAISIPAGRLRADLLADDGTPTLRAEALRRRLGAARHVFVSLAGQRPFYCDWESAFSLEVLGHQLAASNGWVSIADMMPAPDALWLTFEDGVYTSELRFVATLDGEAHNGQREWFE